MEMKLQGTEKIFKQSHTCNCNLRTFQQRNLRVWSFYFIVYHMVTLAVYAYMLEWLQDTLPFNSDYVHTFILTEMLLDLLIDI